MHDVWTALLQVKSVKAHQGQGHEPGGDQLDGQAPEGAGASLQIYLQLKAGKAGQGHRRPQTAEKGEEHARAQAVAALGDEQGGAQGGAVGGHRGR